MTFRGRQLHSGAVRVKFLIVIDIASVASNMNREESFREIAHKYFVPRVTFFIYNTSCWAILQVVLWVCLLHRLKYRGPYRYAYEVSPIYTVFIEVGSRDIANSITRILVCSMIQSNFPTATKKTII